MGFSLGLTQRDSPSLAVSLHVHSSGQEAQTANDARPQETVSRANVGVMYYQSLATAWASDHLSIFNSNSEGPSC